MSILADKVLLLNKNMHPLRCISVRRAFFLLTKPRRKVPSAKVATAVEIDENHDIISLVEWDEWISLPVRPGDRFVGISKQQVRVPSIIVLGEFDRMVVVKRTFTKTALWDRQKGCDMYSSAPLKWHECDIDHFVPRSKGGETSWRNCGLTPIETNRRKGDKLAHEVGLRLRTPLVEPPAKPMFVQMRRDVRFPEWDAFIPG